MLGTIQMKHMLAKDPAALEGILDARKRQL